MFNLRTKSEVKDFKVSGLVSVLGQGRSRLGFVL